jgi:acyl carrier protein
MEHVEVLDSLKAILADLGIPAESLCENTLLYAHLGLDSVETVKLVLELKRRLGIDLKLGGRQDLTLAQICQLVEAAPSAQSL